MNYQKKRLKKEERVKELILTFLKSLSMVLTAKESKKYFGNIQKKDWFAPEIPVQSSIKPLITWIGHSSFLIQLNGINLLIDPIFTDLMFFYKRNFPPGIEIDFLPKIDFILISHNHGDHLNKATLLKLKKHNATILVPKGAKNWFIKNKFKNVIEKNWWEHQIFSINGSIIKFDFLPAVHWSGQNLFEIDKSLCGSWMISINDFNIYFAGDSAYADHFKDVAQKFKFINLALLPIAPCKPRKFVKYSHMDAEEAIKAFLDLNAKNFIPMHWGTFKINLDKFDEPIQILKNSWELSKEKLVDKRLHIIKFGQRLEF